ncbi:MAG: cysteine--tRNA ligase [Elusimicrobia bacterium]|nr:cysteine--tRNA ligase [Elusimicrobiota bacterium]
MKEIYFYNTLTRKKEAFLPGQSGKVGMYVCGITPYDYTHLGHARCYVVFDVIRRFLEEKNLKVKYVQNFTDIDDKIIERANSQKKPFYEVSQFFIKEYKKDIKRLGVKDPDVSPLVSEHIPEIIDAVKKLIEKGFAYEKNGSVYFRVLKFKGYGKLSGKKIEELKPGARVEVDEGKEHFLDFALWKKSKENEPFWKSPWGCGRPGWHIECSVMSMKYIGSTLDIHGGGEDLIFPHHENEIAQSEALTGVSFCRFWLHNGFVTINKEKMSKSLKNFFTLKEIFEKFSPRAVRFFLLSTHYRDPLDFSPDALKEAERMTERISRIFEIKQVSQTQDAIKKQAQDLLEGFYDALSDDLNTSVAISRFLKLVKLFNSTKSEFVFEKILNADRVLNFLTLEGKKKVLLMSEEEILKKINERDRARKEKNYELADKIREELSQKGILLEDTPQGTKWRIK